MNLLSGIARILVGGLFIFSGLIKINDPVGTAIKLEEYFAVFSSNFGSFFSLFEPIALQLGVFLVVLEVVLGVAVLLYYRMNITTWALLLLILFFSVLTFYSAFTGEVTDCGCFGDAIKLTPWESFTKDMVLLVFILILFIRRRDLKPILSDSTGHLVIASATVIGLFLSVYAIRNLPFIDFRAYKEGTDIPQAMQPSEDLRYQYVMEKDGELFEFESYPTDTTYQYKDIVLLNPEAQPKITDYSIWNSNGDDLTNQSFQGVQLIVVVHFAEKAHSQAFDGINTLLGQVDGKMGVMVLTASDEPTFEDFRHQVQLAAPFFNGDATVLKTMVRSNPGILLLKDGVVIGKWHHRNLPSSQQLSELARR